MKNIVIIIKNLPDEAVDKAWVGGLQEFEVEGKQEVTIDYKASPLASKERTIDAIAMLQANFIYQEILKMPRDGMTRMLLKIKDWAFRQTFGNFNNN